MVPSPGNQTSAAAPAMLDENSDTGSSPPCSPESEKSTAATATSFTHCLAAPKAPDSWDFALPDLTSEQTASAAAEAPRSSRGRRWRVLVVVPSPEPGRGGAEPRSVVGGGPKASCSDEPQEVAEPPQLFAADATETAGGSSSSSSGEGLLQRLRRRQSDRLSGSSNTASKTAGGDGTCSSRGGCAGAGAPQLLALGPAASSLEFALEADEHLPHDIRELQTEPKQGMDSLPPHSDDKEETAAAAAPDVGSFSSDALVPLSKADADAASTAVSQSQPGGGGNRLRPESRTDAELHDWMMFFGMKPTQSREFMVKRLRAIDDFLNEDQSTGLLPEPKKARSAQEGAVKTQAATASAAAAAVVLPPPFSQLSEEVPLSQDQDLAADGSISASQQSARAAKAAAKAARQEQLVAEMIRKDKELYERLLLFESVEIGEVRDRLAALCPELRNLGEQRLRKFLDSQGVVFSSTWSSQSREAISGRKRF